MLSQSALRSIGIKKPKVGMELPFIYQTLAENSENNDTANMMSESIQNRSKEFAILESIGMTRKQIKKMIVFESLGYSILSIVIALIIGLPASYLVFTNFNIYRIPYVFPVIKTLLLFITIIIVCVVTSLFVFSKSKSETIIELLRKDEV